MARSRGAGRLPVREPATRADGGLRRDGLRRAAALTHHRQREEVREALRAVDAFLRRPPEDRHVHRTLRRVRDILDPIVSEVPFSQVMRTLRWRASLFDELRGALRLIPKTPGRNPATREPVETIPPEQARTQLSDIRKAIETLTAELRQRRRSGRKKLTQDLENLPPRSPSCFQPA